MSEVYGLRSGTAEGREGVVLMGGSALDNSNDSSMFATKLS